MSSKSRASGAVSAIGPLIRLPPPSPRRRGEGTRGNHSPPSRRRTSPLPACGERVRVRGKSHDRREENSQPPDREPSIRLDDRACGETELPAGE
ncbi:hypothetical protein CN114_24350, partial [Sinorhizobium meliloti]